MKQYTTPDQTAKLIELGFEKPPKKGLLFQSNVGGCLTDLMFAEENYSIGELIEKLEGVSELEITRYGSGWEVGDELRAFPSEELIDALYDMCVRLKEEGVI